ncbi:arginine ABC transporter ATP-binding protein [Clostridium sp. MF28]|uniref:amino acid ABC transporter ATP-binding protein n=1 Tax=Clostridium TaxID=1485 RepID=UPI000CF98EE7|nr:MULTISPECIES: amino acid ABC transporter ATP-binding protein [Clostridium]AVK50437.1 arginine ABC transporter ATP-binding protein [Clostridium sp. MF28]PSM59164.1 arginine ABC transporter ATP-binding protein ArtP [Clostridium diolis]
MVKIENLNKHFNNLHILKDINLTIESNKTTVIIGPSGSGKTTLLRCINLLELPDNGTISMNKDKLDFSRNNIHKNEINNFRKKTGMVFQNFNLFPHRTAIENIIEGPITVLKTQKQKAIKDAELLLDKIGLLDKKNSYPHELSGGQQQRIAIARALAMKPEILLFDEPTSALDPELEVEVLSLIKELAKENYTIAIVTHKMSFAREVGDEIVFVNQGEIIEKGTYSDLDNSSNDRIKQFLNLLN